MNMPLSAEGSLLESSESWTAWRVEMEQRALDWGQSPAESCPKDGNEMSNKKL